MPKNKNINEAMLRMLIYKHKNEAMKRCLIKNGRKIVIDEEKFQAFLHGINKEPY